MPCGSNFEVFCRMGTRRPEVIAIMDCFILGRRDRGNSTIVASTLYKLDFVWTFLGLVCRETFEALV